MGDGSEHRCRKGHAPCFCSNAILGSLVLTLEVSKEMNDVVFLSSETCCQSFMETCLWRSVRSVAGMYVVHNCIVDGIKLTNVLMNENKLKMKDFNYGNRCLEDGGWKNISSRHKYTINNHSNFTGCTLSKGEKQNIYIMLDEWTTGIWLPSLRTWWVILASLDQKGKLKAPFISAIFVAESGLWNSSNIGLLFKGSNHHELSGN